jgi:hypothetical protein
VRRRLAIRAVAANANAQHLDTDHLTVGGGDAHERHGGDRTRKGGIPITVIDICAPRPPPDLLRSVARRVVGRNVLWLIKLWLRVPVEERDSDGKRRMSGAGARASTVRSARQTRP